MARGTREPSGTTASRHIDYARQVSKDVPQEKLNELHTRPPDEKTNSPGCPQRQSTSYNTIPCPKSKTLVGTNYEDIHLDENGNSDDNEKRLKQPADQFSNDLNTSVISNKLSREIQDLHIIPTGSDKPGDGMNQYFLESMSAGRSTKSPGCNPKELSDNVTDEEKTLVDNFGILNLNLSKNVKVEPVDSDSPSENDATETDTECNGGCVNEATLEVPGDVINSAISGTGTIKVKSCDDSGSLDKKEIQVAEVKSKDDGERFKPENYQTPNEHSLQDKNVCPSGRPAAGNRYIDFKELGIQNQNERLGEKCQCEPLSAFHKHNDNVCKVTEKELEAYLKRHKQSVGYIQWKGSEHVGTCFRVGPKHKGFLITAYHVFYALYLGQNKILSGDNLFELSNINISVCFPDWKTDNHWYNFKPVVHCGCHKLDFVLLELEGDEFPEPFQDFGRVREDMPNFLHSYQDSIMKIDKRVKILNVTEEVVCQATDYCQERYHFYKPYIHKVSKMYNHTILDKEKVPILTELRNGASGCPGLHLNDDGSAVVAYMYLRGYPYQYYMWPKDQLDRSSFPSCLLVEQALKIEEIYDSLNRVNSDLAKCVFSFTSFD